MKAVLIHAVHWNERNYIGAGGFRGGTGYVKEKHYGHEEWNNNPKWRWRDPDTGVAQRLFFTNANSDQLRKFMTAGNEIAIAMVASHHGKKDLVGIACDVRAIDEDARYAIARKLRLPHEYERVWDEAPRIRELFSEKRTRFEKQIKGDQDFFRWSSPARCFKWFNPAIPIRSEDLLETDQITHRFGGSQGVAPDGLIKVLKGYLPANSPILDWLSEGQFTDVFISKTERPTGRNAKGSGGRGNASSRKKFTVRRVNTQYEVFPRHTKLQKAFVRWIERKFPHVTATQNWNYVDVRLDHGGSKVSFVEVKPCDRTTVQFAVREAIGQLLEYRHRHDRNAKMAVALAVQPGQETLRLLKSLGIAALWKTGRGFEGTQRTA